MTTKLSAAELREALRLVLDDLRTLPYDPCERAVRLGCLEAHIETIVGDSPHGVEPMFGLLVLRQDRAEAIQKGPSPG